MGLLVWPSCIGRIVTLDLSSSDGGAVDRPHHPAVDERVPGSVSATMHPPNPPPVIRAPYTPGVRQQLRDGGVHRRRSRCRTGRAGWRGSATISSPAVARSPAASASANSRTRRFSPTTCCARARTTGSAIVVDGGERWRGAADRSRARPRRTRRLGRRTGCRRACGARRSCTTISTSSGIGTGVTVSAPQSMSSAWPATTAAMRAGP